MIEDRTKNCLDQSESKTSLSCKTWHGGTRDISKGGSESGGVGITDGSNPHPHATIEGLQPSTQIANVKASHQVKKYGQ